MSQVVKEITVKDLNDLYNSGEYNIEIDSPDGFQPVTAWFNKGVLPMVRVTTDNQHMSECAVNHMVQLSDLQWCPAAQLTPDMQIITASGIANVSAVDVIEDAECYDFTVDHPNHRYWGDGISSHNSGKSFICAGNLVRNAQKQGIYVVLIDTENALDEAWLQALGVETTDDKLLKLNMAMIDDVAKVISDFVKEYRPLPSDERPKVLFVIDSLGMLLTPTDVNQFEAGEMKGDMGRKPKALTALVRNCVNMFGSLNIGLVATNHTYASQDPYSPDDKISGGAGFVYASSIVVAMKKLKLKEDESGNKVSEVLGIRAGCKIMKTRYSKPFEDITLQIPYSTGMSPYSGFFDLIEKQGMVTKEGNRYVYIDLNGEIHKYFRKEWSKNENNIMDLVMSEFHEKSKVSTQVTPESDTTEPV